MGIFNRIKRWWALGSLESRLEEKRLQLELSAVEMQVRRLDEVSSREWNLSSPSNWDRLSYSSNYNADADVTENDYYDLIKNSNRLYLKNQTYFGCLQQFKRFVYGKGPKISAKVPEKKTGESITTEEDSLAKQCNEYWHAFWVKNGLKKKDKEIHNRKNRDGDCFMSFEGVDGDTASGTILINGKEFTVPVFRFLSASRVKDVNSKFPFGIETEDGDPETVVRYHYSNETETSSRPIDAEHIVHWKGNADSDWRRGLPILTSTMHWFPELNRFAQNAVDRTSIQNAHVLLRTVKNSASATAIRNQNLDTSNSSDAYQQKRVNGGTVITAGAGVDYKFLGPQMEGARPEDARLLMLLIASGSGLAEYMVSADASNSNYSSTMVAESPAVRTFEDAQDEDEYYWGLVWRKVILFGVEIGALPPNAYTECVVHWNPLIARNAKEEAEALTMLSIHGLSDETILTKSGFNSKEEFAKSESELELRAKRSPDVSADGEEDEARSQLQREMAEAVNFGEHHCGTECGSGCDN